MSNPVERRHLEMLTEEQRQHLAAVYRLMYHGALARVLDAVHGLVAAVDRADAAMQRAGIADDAPLSDEERALFASAQALLEEAAKRNPGIRLLFPRSE